MKSKDRWHDLLNEAPAVRETEADGVTCGTRVTAMAAQARHQQHRGNEGQRLAKDLFSPRLAQQITLVYYEQYKTKADTQVKATHFSKTTYKQGNQANQDMP